MLTRLLTLLVLALGLVVLPASTYYISPIGNDSNPGTLSQPWAHYPKAASVVAAGDTVLVMPGIYPRNANTNNAEQGDLVLTASGTSNAPIIFRALGPVTNGVPFEVRSPYYYFDGFTWDGVNGLYLRNQITGGSWPAPGSGYVTMTNCTVQNCVNMSGFAQDPPLASNPIPETAPGHCTVINCVFINMTNASSDINLQGVGNLVQGCVFANGVSQDAINLWGSNSIIRGCTFTNMQAGVGWGNHPDILQTFGDNGNWCAAMLFEQNYVVNCGIQLMQFEQGPRLTNTNLWGITLRNNVFEDSVLQCSIDTANARLFNNTWLRCGSSDKTPIINFTFYDPKWDQYRGAAYGGRVVNNAFIDCNTAYSAAPSGPYFGTLTNSAGAVAGTAHLWLASDGVQVYGLYSNLAGAVISGTVYGTGGDCYTIDATNFVAGVYNFKLPFSTSACSSDSQWADYYGNAMHFRINTTAAPTGEVKTTLLPYTVDLTTFLAQSDYNYKGLASEVHGIQTGNVMLTGTNNFSPLLLLPTTGSVLIDLGMDLGNVGVTKDFVGTPRPQGAGFDIGAFEFTGGTTVVRPPPPVGLHIATTGP